MRVAWCSLFVEIYLIILSWFGTHRACVQSLRGDIYMMISSTLVMCTRWRAGKYWKDLRVTRDRKATSHKGVTFGILFCEDWHMEEICYMSSIKRSDGHSMLRCIFLSRQLAKCLVNEVNTSSSEETVLNGRSVPGVRFLTKRFRSQHATETWSFSILKQQETLSRKKGSTFKLTLSNFNNRLCFIFFPFVCAMERIFSFWTLCFNP